MGYETKLYVGIEYSFTATEEHVTIGTVATVDLSKAGSTSATGRLLSQSAASAERFYAVYAELPDDMAADYDGSGIITRDPYGSRLTAVPIRPLIAAMRADNAEEPYRRFTLAIAMLEAVLGDDQWAEDTIRVIQYGH